MIIRAVFISLIVASSVFAAPVSFDFGAVSLPAFAQATFKGLLRRDYVMSPELLSMDRKISISVAGIDAEKIPSFVEGVLRQQGIAVTFRDGIYYLDPVRVAGLLDVVDAAKSGAVPAPVAQPLALSAPAASDGFVRVENVESSVYIPQNRPADFLASVLTAAFGGKAAVVAGGNLVLSGSSADLGHMLQVCVSVDSLPRLVDVSASWVEVTDTAGAGRGISVLANVLGARLGLSLGSVNSGSAVSLKNTNFQIVVDALSSDSRFKQVSNSRVVGDDYEKLVLSVGDETPTISSTGRDNAGNTVQNVVYRPSGVIVDVVPKVLGGGRIRLAIDGQISNFKATVTGVSSSPTLIKRQVKTAVTVGDGDVLLIGGLNDQTTSGSMSTLPFLPASWSSRSDASSKTDLVLILSAKVVSN